MGKKELIVKTKYEELYKTEYGYWIEHIEYEDDAETVRFEGGGCSISNEVVDKLLDRAREEGVKMGMENAWEMVSALLDTLDINKNEEEIRILAGINKLFDREITKLALKLKNNK